jgi:hypothetical protein
MVTRPSLEKMAKDGIPGRSGPLIAVLGDRLELRPGGKLEEVNMHFRVGYIIRNYDFQGAQIVASDPIRRIEVQFTKRPQDETDPRAEPFQAVATATCESDLPPAIEEAVSLSGSLPWDTEGVSQAFEELKAFVLRTLRLARWRANCPKSAIHPIQGTTGSSWSLDGKAWKDFGTYSLKIQFLGGFWPWTDEFAEFVKTEILGDLDEPLAHELLREAVLNRKDTPRSSLVLAVAAAEVGFKQFASKTFPDATWVLEKLQSPPLDTMFKVFPWPKLTVRINGKVPSIPGSIKSGLKKAVELRNQVVHAGVAKLEAENVDYALTSARDLLYFLDALQGQKWAFKHMSADALKSLS